MSGEQAWVAGQRVVIVGRYHETVATVERVTASGMPVVNGERYSREGLRPARDRLGRDRLVVATDALLARLAQQAAFARIERRAETAARDLRQLVPSERALLDVGSAAAALSALEAAIVAAKRKAEEGAGGG